MLGSLAFLAPFSLIASDLPRAWAWPIALTACAWAIRDARRYRAMPARQLTIPSGRAAASCDGERIDDLHLGWRGPLAFLRWRAADGRLHRASFCPDTLDAGMRRELRMAVARRDPASEHVSSEQPSMAG